MSKGKDSKKADKKEPAKTAKEKKAEKREKKANKDKFWLIRCGNLLTNSSAVVLWEL